MTKPNILYIHSHDTGRYIQPYGHSIPTPNMQRLAEEGVLFRQNFCMGPTCSPSRAALLTGQCPHSSGMIGLAHRGFSLNNYRQHIVHTLRRAGYTSTLIGVQHIAKDASVIGYDAVAQTRGYSAEKVAPVAADFLRSRPKEPFFLSVGFSETHREYPQPGPTEDARYCMPPAPLPDTPETRQDMACFKASARLLDEGIGKVLRALDESGMRENTLVVCTTDHGIAFPRMKCNLYDSGIGVLLIMRGPGKFEGGRVIDSLVSHVDIYPTLCDLAGIKHPNWLQGRSLLPLVNGETDEINEEVFAEVTYHAAYEPQRCVRTHRWKYIRRFSDQMTPVMPNCDDSPSKNVWLKYGWRSRHLVREELYDLVFDPHETNNLAAAPSHQDVLHEMRGRLEAWMKRTDDPLLNGPVPAPKGARVNDPSGLSPKEPTIAL